MVNSDRHTVSLAVSPQNDTSIFEDRESAVRLYCRKFPVVFERAKGARVYDESGKEYLDFFCGAGALNYGHNLGLINQRLIEYLSRDGMIHALDMYTSAKREFLQKVHEVLLSPRGMRHRVQFCGPGGTDSVEAALKLVRRVTGRRNVVAFSGGFHGMSRGSLAVTGSHRARHAGGAGLEDVAFVPYEQGPSGVFDSIGYLEQLLCDPTSGVELPAAVIVESVQIEGGVYVASDSWLRQLRAVTRKHGVLLICDEIQAGCGRTGDFFGFDPAGIEPDLVTVSKSIGGGLPLSLLLVREDLDVWEPGDHTGTFRGNQLAFVAGAAALELWTDESFLDVKSANSARMQLFAHEVCAADSSLSVRGRGMLWGIDTSGTGDPSRAQRIQQDCFEKGVILELSGRRDQVVKLMPPLNIGPVELARGLALVTSAIAGSR